MSRTRELDRVLNNINREVGKIKGATVGGLLKAGLVVQAEAQRRVPVEYGKLRASAFTRESPEDPLAVEVGFSAAYALFVHENTEQKLKGLPRKSGLGVYWGPDGEPRFLANALTDKKRQVLDIVAKDAKVKR